METIKILMAIVYKKTFSCRIILNHNNKIKSSKKLILERLCNIFKQQMNLYSHHSYKSSLHLK
jgi:hypothetical protein